MELSIIRPPKLVVALDIGSTYSGYAWQYRDEFEGGREIHFNTNWGVGALQLTKTKTCLMFKYNDKTQGKPHEKSSLQLDPSEVEDIRIGHNAENTYMMIAKTMEEGELLGKYYLFNRFKMRLYEQKVDDDMLVEDQLLQPLRLFDVMTLFIKELKKKCLDTIKRRHTELNENEILFVVTVPAIWSDSAKQFMRKATIAAGVRQRNMLLALEAEAAAISCIHLTSQQKEDMNNFGDVGQKFLVADLGGGTADLSAVKVLKDGSLKELYQVPFSIPRGIEIDEISFLFESDFVRNQLFQTTCSLIYNNTIWPALSREEAKGITTVILVGGFSESPIVIKMLRERVKQDFPGVKVVVPDSPFKSVLLGAVLYGHDPMIFSSRISKETYGVDVYVTFDDTKHDVSKKWHNKESGEILCSNIFHIHVKKGQSVSLLEPQPTKIYCPVYKQQKAITFNIYSSTSTCPVYVTDEGCKQIGKVRVEMPDTSGGTGRQIEVSMIYGGTQIAVFAKEVTSGKEVNAKIVFG